MQYYYGDNNILRALDEAEFWKHQEAEHTTVVILVTPNLETTYISRLKQFGYDFHVIQAEIVKYIQSITRSKGHIGPELHMQILKLIRQAIEQSRWFVDLLEEMLQDSEAVKSNTSSQTVINHLIRESQYFIGIDQLVLF